MSAVKEIIERAKAAIAIEKETTAQKEERMNREMGVLQRYDWHLTKIVQAKADFEVSARRIAEVCEGETIPDLVHGLVQDWSRLTMLASECATIEFIKAHRTQILDEYRRQVVETAAQELKTYIADNLEVLKKHGAVRLEL